MARMPDQGHPAVSGRSAFQVRLDWDIIGQACLSTRHNPGAPRRAGVPVEGATGRRSPGTLPEV